MENQRPTTYEMTQSLAKALGETACPHTGRASDCGACTCGRWTALWWASRLMEKCEEQERYIETLEQAVVGEVDWRSSKAGSSYSGWTPAPD